MWAPSSWLGVFQRERAHIKIHLTNAWLRLKATKKLWNCDAFLPLNSILLQLHIHGKSASLRAVLVFVFFGSVSFVWVERTRNSVRYRIWISEHFHCLRKCKYIWHIAVNDKTMKTLGVAYAKERRLPLDFNLTPETKSVREETPSPLLHGTPLRWLFAVQRWHIYQAIEIRHLRYRATCNISFQFIVIVWFLQLFSLKCMLALQRNAFCNHKRFVRIMRAGTFHAVSYAGLQIWNLERKKYSHSATAIYSATSIEIGQLGYSQSEHYKIPPTLPYSWFLLRLRCSQIFLISLTFSQFHPSIIFSQKRWWKNAAGGKVLRQHHWIRTIDSHDYESSKFRLNCFFFYANSHSAEFILPPNG